MVDSTYIFTFNVTFNVPLWKCWPTRAISSNNDSILAMYVFTQSICWHKADKDTFRNYILTKFIEGS